MSAFQCFRTDNDRFTVENHCSKCCPFLKYPQRRVIAGRQKHVTEWETVVKESVLYTGITSPTAPRHPPSGPGSNMGVYAPVFRGAEDLTGGDRMYALRAMRGQWVPESEIQNCLRVRHGDHAVGILHSTKHVIS